MEYVGFPSKEHHNKLKPEPLTPNADTNNQPNPTIQCRS